MIDTPAPENPEKQEQETEGKETKKPEKEKAWRVPWWFFLLALLVILAVPAFAYLAGWRVELKRDLRDGEALTQIYQKVTSSKLL